jgi:hypothetical protein
MKSPLSQKPTFVRGLRKDRIVGSHQKGGLLFPHQAGEKFPHLVSLFGVQVAGGFVG